MTMKAAVLVLCVALALALPEAPANDHYLFKNNRGNFGCNVNSVEVKTEVEGAADTVTKDDILGAFAQVANLEWAHVAQTSFASFDGRNDEKILGTPGGDMGEFIQAIQAFTQVRGPPALSQEEIQASLQKYLTIMTRDKFSYQTDFNAYTRLAVATGCRNLRVTEIGSNRHKREDILRQIAAPAHIGDPFIKFLALNATDLGINPDYIHDSLAAYHNVLWARSSKLAEKLCYLELQGAHKEAALVIVKTPDFCTDQGLAPMVSPALACGAPVLIYHPDAVKLFRRELVSVLTDNVDVQAEEVLAVYNQIATTNFDKFINAFAPGTTVFSVTFKNTSPLTSPNYVPTLD
jgi:hypothetical protein